MPKAILISALTFAGLVFTGSAFAQEGKAPVASPPAKADCMFTDGKTIHVDYSSPRMRGRKIYGGLVPWKEVWRAGANEATTFVTTADVIVDGKTVPAGSYTIFTVPEPDKWTLVVSKKTGEWGIPYPGESLDLLRAPMTVSKLPEAAENLTIAFDARAQSCTMRLDWETTRASVQISEKK